jgi:hypothetical protein
MKVSLASRLINESANLNKTSFQSPMKAKLSIDHGLMTDMKLSRNKEAIGTIINTAKASAFHKRAGSL